MLKKTKNKLAAIFILGLVIRIIGIKHGFPFIFHPDEPAIIRSALGIRFNLNPEHFDWPHLYIYLNYFIYMIFAKIRDLITLAGMKEQASLLIPLIWNDDLIFYLITRLFSALLGAATVIPIFLSGKKLFNEKTGFLAALAFAVTPFHVWHSHYALSDVPMTFFTAWVLYFSAQILFRKDLKCYVLAGVFVGLAASTKYNGALSAIFIVVAHLLRVFSEKNERLFDREALENIFLSGISSVIAFVIGTPFSVLDYKTFIRTDGPKGALWQFTNVGKVTLAEQFQSFISQLTHGIIDDFGYTILVFFLASVVYIVVDSIKNKNAFLHKDLILLFSTGLFLIFYVSGLEKTRSHYFFMAYPPVILAAAGFIYKYLIGKVKALKTMIWLVLLLPPLYLSFLGSYIFFREDTRLLLDKWLLTNGRSSTKYYSGGQLSLVLSERAERVDDAFSNLPSNSFLMTADLSRDDLELVKTFDNYLRRGPIIRVFKK